MSAHWTPPANRSNYHLRRYRAQLYTLPKSDKTGQLTRLTEQANEVLSTVRFRYSVGMRVHAVTSRYGGEWITGQIIMATHNLGLNEYVIRDDSGNRHIIAENGVKFVISIVLSSNDTQSQANKPIAA